MEINVSYWSKKQYVVLKVEFEPDRRSERRQILSLYSYLIRH